MATGAAEQRSWCTYDIYTHLFNSGIQCNGQRLFRKPHSTIFFILDFDVNFGTIAIDLALRKDIETSLWRFEEQSLLTNQLLFSVDGGAGALIGLPRSIMRENVTGYLLSIGLVDFSRFFKSPTEKQVLCTNRTDL